jgi:ABC-type multidrug transport system ATPase subunit
LESASHGHVTINGYQVVPQFDPNVRSHIGICPQFDVLWPKLTAREHLILFARIKGIPADKITAHVDKALADMSLTEYADRPCGKFSGGNKRKLSIALAVLGAPAVIFLDEPTTGIDVMARRHIWEAIRVLKQRCCIILTTHSMEEAEALSDRIAILTNGHIRALGTPGRLKSVYGSAYNITLKATTDQDALDAIARLKAAHEHSELVVVKQNLGLYADIQVKKGTMDHTQLLGVVFTLLEEMRQQGQLVDFSVSQATLSQVFVDFVATSVREDEDEQ